MKENSSFLTLKAGTSFPGQRINSLGSNTGSGHATTKEKRRQLLKVKMGWAVELACKSVGRYKKLMHLLDQLTSAWEKDEQHNTPLHSLAALASSLTSLDAQQKSKGKKKAKGGQKEAPIKETPPTSTVQPMLMGMPAMTAPASEAPPSGDPVIVHLGRQEPATEAVHLGRQEPATEAVHLGTQEPATEALPYSVALTGQPNLESTDSLARMPQVLNPPVQGRTQNKHRFQPRSGAPTSKGYKKAAKQSKRARKNTAKGALYQQTFGRI